MLELARKDDVSVRFIEEMPFNGTDGQGNNSFWPMKKILDHIKSEFPFQKIQDPPFSTSANYKVDGFAGDFGIIAAYTRTFCGSCNRIRITPQGSLRTCLYGDGVLNVRDLIRNGSSDEELLENLKSVLNKRAKDGFEAENQRHKSKPASESMATIGG
jgi:cyclic pyranopterin phosphate synthase